MHTQDRSTGTGMGMAAGAVGGLVGSSAMVLANHLFAATGLGTADLGRHHQERRADAKPNDADGTISDEPATRKAASRAAETIAGRPLDEREKAVAGPIAHHLFGAMVGAFYGAAASRIPAVAAGGGIPYGVAVWLAAAEVGLPLIGLSRRPDAYPASRHATSLASHLVFGATVEAVRRVMTRR